MFLRKSALEKELFTVGKKEQKLKDKKINGTDNAVNLFLNSRIPPNLKNRLEEAFGYAFGVVFTKGEGIINKTYSAEKLNSQYKINKYASDIRKDRKSLKQFNKTSFTAANTAFSAVSGTALGILGIGLPDIVLFVSVLLKNMYEISLNYGYDCKDENEKKFILMLMRASLSKGDEFLQADKEADSFINGEISDTDLESEIQKTAKVFALELLCAKFLQGIPFVGVVGGGYNLIYINAVTKYAKMKYYKRFLTEKQREDNNV